VARFSSVDPDRRTVRTPDSGTWGRSVFRYIIRSDRADRALGQWDVRDGSVLLVDAAGHGELRATAGRVPQCICASKSRGFVQFVCLPGHHGSEDEGLRRCMKPSRCTDVQEPGGGTPHARRSPPSVCFDSIPCTDANCGDAGRRAASAQTLRLLPTGTESALTGHEHVQPRRWPV
jgi:hypothetical protein